MHTLKKIERLWGQGRFTQLFTDLIAGRAEAPFAGHLQADHPAVAAAAIAVIRLDELSQSHVPLQNALLRAVIGAQESDGGWGSPMLTALCLRALLVNNGGGDAIGAGLGYLAALQQSSGIWPSIPLRRLPGDPLTTAFILSQLGNENRFREALDFEAVMDWFVGHLPALDAQTRRLWTRVSLRNARWQPQAMDDEARLASLWS